MQYYKQKQKEAVCYFYIFIKHGSQFMSNHDSIVHNILYFKTNWKNEI